jgi:hypothetical protein
MVTGLAGVSSGENIRKARRNWLGCPFACFFVPDFEQ